MFREMDCVSRCDSIGFTPRVKPFYTGERKVLVGVSRVVCEWQFSGPHDEEKSMSTLFAQSTPNSAGYRDITPARVAAGREGARLIDVREPHEFTGE
jgi:hypothetical protein